jgi:hypothetical protein
MPDGHLRQREPCQDGLARLSEAPNSAQAGFCFCPLIRGVMSGPGTSPQQLMLGLCSVLTQAVIGPIEIPQYSSLLPWLRCGILSVESTGGTGQ